MGSVEFRELCHYAQNKRCVSVFYDRFVNLCELKGVSLSKAAVEAGISKSLVTKWKNNSINIPSPEVLDKLSKYFGISISELLGENEQKEKPAISEDDRLNAEFIELFSKLSDAEKTMMISQLKGLVSDR